jgi:hypothetical protein
MAAFNLAHLGRNVIHVGGSERITIRNTSGDPADLFVDLKVGAAWCPFTGRVTLPAGGCWSASPAELGHDQIRVVVRGADDGRSIVRVEY